MTLVGAPHIWYIGQVWKHHGMLKCSNHHMIVIVVRFSKWLTATVSTEQSGWPVCTHARSQLDTLWKHVLATDVVVGWTWTYRLHRRLAEKKRALRWSKKKKTRFYCFLWYLTRKGSKTEERLKEEKREKKRERKACGCRPPEKAARFGQSWSKR